MEDLLLQPVIEDGRKVIKNHVLSKERGGTQPKPWVLSWFVHSSSDIDDYWSHYVLKVMALGCLSQHTWAHPLVHPRLLL